MIVVTTPISKIGGRVAQHLVEVGESVRVIVQGSRGDAAILDRAFDRAEAVFWL